MQCSLLLHYTAWIKKKHILKYIKNLKLRKVRELYLINSNGIYVLNLKRNISFAKITKIGIILLKSTDLTIVPVIYTLVYFICDNFRCCVSIII